MWWRTCELPFHFIIFYLSILFILFYFLFFVLSCVNYACLPRMQIKICVIKKSEEKKNYLLHQSMAVAVQGGHAQVSAKPQDFSARMTHSHYHTIYTVCCRPTFFFLFREWFYMSIEWPIFCTHFNLQWNHSKFVQIIFHNLHKRNPI